MNFGPLRDLSAGTAVVVGIVFLVLVVGALLFLARRLRGASRRGDPPGQP